jgi:hypothetical protein
MARCFRTGTDFFVFMSALLTSTIPVTEVGEAPHVAYANGVPQAGQDELRLASPVPTVRVLQCAPAAPDIMGRCPFLQHGPRSDSGSQCPRKGRRKQRGENK